MSTSSVDPPAVRRRALCGVGVAACALLAGCGTDGEGGAAPSTASADSTRVEHAAPGDWRDATYRMTCDGLAPGGFSVTLVDGAAQVPADVGQTPFYDDFDVRYEAEASGDVDGDGEPDTVVLLQCTPQPSNGFVEEVQVFAADGDRLGVLPSATTLPEAATLPPLYDPAGLSVDRGDVVAAMKVYGPDDSHATGPSERVTVRWHWEGQGFVRVP